MLMLHIFYGIPIVSSGPVVSFFLFFFSQSILKYFVSLETLRCCLELNSFACTVCVSIDPPTSRLLLLKG